MGTIYGNMEGGEQPTDRQGGRNNTWAANRIALAFLASFTGFAWTFAGAFFSPTSVIAPIVMTVVTAYFALSHLNVRFTAHPPQEVATDVE